MRRESWKLRLKEMEEAARKVVEYSNSLENSDAFSNDQKTIDACIRNLQILGDAAKNIPTEIQRELSNIPWKQIKGMRNILVHEYFGTDSEIIWTTIKNDLPKLIIDLEQLNSRYQTSVHSWKVCPPGEYYVSGADVDEHSRSGYIVRNHPRRDHCRESKSSIKNLLTRQEIDDIVRFNFQDLNGGPSSDPLGFKKNGTKFDSLIRGWTKFWNETLKPDDPLDPDVVKALMASESSFNPDAGKGKRSAAKGLLQLMPATIRYLKGEREELKDYIFIFESDEVFDPSLNIASGIRWLFRKKETASARLNRPATWEETVAEYKDYLRRKLKNPNQRQKGMDDYRGYLKKLKEAKHEQ